MRNLILAVIGPLVLLAACDSERTPSGADVKAAVDKAKEMADEVQDKATPTPAPQGSAEPRTGIPETFQGRWGLVAADCEPGRADAKGLMDVGAHRLVFYESRATPTSILQTMANELTLQLTFAGEGQTWQRSTRLTLLNGGGTLVREEIEPSGTFRYTRCPETNR